MIGVCDGNLSWLQGTNGFTGSETNHGEVLEQFAADGTAADPEKSGVLDFGEKIGANDSSQAVCAVIFTFKIEFFDGLGPVFLLLWEIGEDFKDVSVEELFRRAVLVGQCFNDFLCYIASKEGGKRRELSGT